MPLPFHPEAPSFSRPNALYLAHAANAAYLRRPTRAAADLLGLSSLLPFRSKLTRFRGFLGLAPTHALLSFRGTDPLTLPNWLTDSMARLTPQLHYPGKVHHGFSSVLAHSWPKLLPLLPLIEDRPLFLTGHSMGGALAVLAACRLALLGITPRAIYTFGSPRLGDEDFCAAHRLPTYRIVHALDLVPHLPLPPKSLVPRHPRLSRLHSLAEKIPTYAHAPTLIYLHPDGSLHHNPADLTPWRTQALRRALNTRGKSFLDGITDHLLSNYIRHLEGIPAPARPRRTRQRSP